MQTQSFSKSSPTVEVKMTQLDASLQHREGELKLANISRAKGPEPDKLQSELQNLKEVVKTMEQLLLKQKRKETAFLSCLVFSANSLSVVFSCNSFSVVISE